MAKKAKAKAKVESNGDEYRVVMLSHGTKEFVQKKVIAKGKTFASQSASIINEVMSALTMSHDFIIGNDKGGIRVYMIVGADGKIKVLSSTFGDLRDCMESAKWTVSKKSKIDFDEARKRDLVNAELRRVSPDTMVECPNCGTTFRVGKKLV